MNCSVYGSKPLSLVTLAVSAPAAALVRFALHADQWVTLGVCLLPPLLGGVVDILFRRPVIRVDRRGVVYHPRSLPRIGWADVAGVDRAPLVEPTVDGLVYHPEDGRRPVLVVLRDADKYLQRLPNALQTGLMVERDTADVCFRLEFTGLSPASAKVYECIRHHLSAARVA